MDSGVALNNHLIVPMKAMSIADSGAGKGSIEKSDEENQRFLGDKPLSTKELSFFTSTIFKGIYCFFGLQISYITWGMMQELIMTTKFAPTELSPDGMFPSASFCVFSNRCLAIIVALCVCWYKHGTIKCSAPIYAFLPCALSNTCSSTAQYAALNYVSFPMQNLFKSTKVIPVMGMGILLKGTSYKAIEYIEAFVITLGVLLFSMTRDHGQKSSGDTSVIGIILLCCYVFFDSFTSQWQSRIYRDYGKIDQYHMMFWVNTWAL